MCVLLHTKRHNLKIKIVKLCFRLAGTRFIFPLKTTETHDKIVPACRLESSSSPSEKGEPSQSLASSPCRRDRADVWEAKAVWFPGQGTGMEGYPENPTSYDPLHRWQSCLQLRKQPPRNPTSQMGKPPNSGVLSTRKSLLDKWGITRSKLTTALVPPYKS